MRILITGGAGFVGSALALALKRSAPTDTIVAFDNLRRRGSEHNVSGLLEHQVEFHHGDLRSTTDLDSLPGNFDWVIDAAAEPSVLAGTDGSPRDVLESNLIGTINCLEFCRRRAKQLIFLSTSRVYSVEVLRNLTLTESATRFDLIPTEGDPPGISPRGIAEEFPTHLPRSYYGASKLASELLIQEYGAAGNLSVLINRCGNIAGPGQFGKTDQGVVGWWVARHFFARPVRYTGFGGRGKQVRDLLHVQDLIELVQQQMREIERYQGQTFNVGGGFSRSTSLFELTKLCQAKTGFGSEPASEKDSASVDIPFYITDNSRAREAFGWQPQRSIEDIVDETLAWLRDNRERLAPQFE